MGKKILIIDDDPDLCLLLEKFLQRKGFVTASAYSGNKGIAKFKEDSYDVVLCDYRLGDKEGKEVLQELKKISPDVMVLIITGYSDIKTAVEVLKLGAYDYITKPLIPDEIINIINEAAGIQTSHQKPPITPSKKQSAKNEPAGSSGGFLVGNAGVTKDLYHQVDIVAPTDYSVILYGESGTGKEVIARTIHERSSRKDKPFVAVDCGTLSKELSGSELFGHVKGAFTGALTDKEGQFEMAHGGTLFLDEIANLGHEVQMSLLRAIQEKKVKRVGSNKEKEVDVRIIVASNENLRVACETGRFREDLYYRFNEFSINIPPLRERGPDIELFADYFLAKTNGELNKEVEGFEEDVLQIFRTYAWPGNIREYRNVIRRSVLLTPSGKVKSSVLPPEIISYSFEPGPGIRDLIKEEMKEPAADKITDLKDAALKAEYDTIMETLKKVKYNKTKAAELLNIDRKTLYNKLKSYESFSNE